MFQAGWFVESMWTQTLVIHMIRTAKIPFAQSRASYSVSILSLLGIAFVTALPFTSLGGAIGFSALPTLYFVFLTLVVLGYSLLVTMMKKAYIRRYGEWL